MSHLFFLHCNLPELTPQTACNAYTFSYYRLSTSNCYCSNTAPNPVNLKTAADVNGVCATAQYTVC